MKLKSAGFLTAATLLLAAGNANANLLFDVYAGATAGVGGATLIADHHHNSDAAQAYGAVLGLDIPLVRAELEYDYMTAGDLKMHVGMVNAYLKMPTVLVQPYLGAGIGMVFDGDAGHGVNVDTTMAYQGMLGLTFDIPVLPFKIDAEARALYADNIFDAAGKNTDVIQYDGRIKLRYIF